MDAQTLMQQFAGMAPGGSNPSLGASFGGSLDAGYTILAICAWGAISFLLAWVFVSLVLSFDAADESLGCAVGSVAG